MIFCWKPSGCFLIGITGKGWTRDGNAIIGSVSDDPYDVRTYLRKIISPQKIDHIGTELVSTSKHTLEERGYFAKVGETTRGLNRAGLGFTCAMILEDKSNKIPTSLIPYASITDYMMRNCETVIEAISLFQSKGGITPAYSVLLADKDGCLAHIEVGSFGVQVIHSYTKDNPGIVLSVNCYQSPDFEKYNDPTTSLSNLKNNNWPRLSRGRSLSKEIIGDCDVINIARVLTDHFNVDRDPLENPIFPGWGYSICNHGTRFSDDYLEEDLPWGTVSAEICEPSRHRFWYSFGWACDQKQEFGDQLFQDRSWRKFLPFRFTDNQDSSDIESVEILSTISGELTPIGVNCLDLEV